MVRTFARIATLAAGCLALVECDPVWSLDIYVTVPEGARVAAGGHPQAVLVSGARSPPGSRSCRPSTAGRSAAGGSSSSRSRRSRYPRARGAPRRWCSSTRTATTRPISCRAAV